MRCNVVQAATVDSNTAKTSQRAALLTAWLCDGQSFTLKEAADALGFESANEAKYLVDDLSIVLPVYEDGRRYQLLPEYLEHLRQSQRTRRRG